MKALLQKYYAWRLRRAQSGVDAALFFGWNQDPQWRWAYANDVYRVGKYTKKLLQVRGSRLIVIAFFGLFAVLSLHAQCVQTVDDPCITVHQSIMDRASKVIDELTEASKVIAAYGNERATTDVERTAYKNALAVTDTALTIFQKGNADRDTVIALQDKVIQMLSQLNDKLLEQMNRKPSGWSKFIKTVKEVALIALGISAGRFAH